MNSRAIVVLGMHRSGTSAVARGVAALSVYLGDDFLDAQPENPTGYWEDRGIVELNERMLRALRLRWDDAAPIDRKALDGLRLWPLRRRATRYVTRTFAGHALWGFKDPRTLRLLPLWRRVLSASRTADAYVVVIRHPLSVAASLFARQAMERESALQLWLAYMVPFLGELRDRLWAVVDYDLLMQQPREQLERIRDRLSLPQDAQVSREIDRFGEEFLDEGLRHTKFSPRDFDVRSDASRLTRDAYTLLYGLAADEAEPDGAFWQAWEPIEREEAKRAARQGRKPWARKLSP